MKKGIITFLFCLIITAAFSQTTYYVTPTGSSSNSGASFALAKDLRSALTKVIAGDSIILQSGTYTIAYTAGAANTITLAQSGTASKMITVCAETNKIATIDFSFPEFMWVQDSYGLELTGSYWKFKGIKITRAGYQGAYVSGGYSVFEHCIFYDNRNSGIEVNKGGHHTTLINCDAYRNYDPKKGGSMADGFAVKQLQGAGNKLIGCRAWDNSDDAYDTFDSPDFVVFENCWAFNNGINIYNDPNIAFAGNGNGFKVGGLARLQPNILKNCVSFGHPKKGFDQNNNTAGVTMLNCTAYNNGTNYGFGGAVDAGQKHVLKNCISLGGLVTISNSTEANNSWSSGFSVSSADFQSLDLSLAPAARNADGSIPETALFRLKSTSKLIDAGVNVGLVYNGTAPDLGAFEYGSTPLVAPTFVLTSGTASQSILFTQSISTIVYTWGGGATDVTVSGLAAGLTATKNAGAKTVTIAGSPTAAGTTTYSIVTVGGSVPMITKTGTITVTAPNALATPTNVSATAASNSVTLNWTPVANATGYLVNFCSQGTGPAIRSQWDFTGAWSIDASNADANLVLDTDPLRFNYVPATTNGALQFAGGAAVPDVAGLLFTQGGATKIRLGFGKGLLYLNGSGIAVTIPCQIGDKITVVGPAGNTAAIDRGYTFTGGSLNTAECLNVNASGIMNAAGANGTWVFTATGTALKITTVTGGMNIQTIKVNDMSGNSSVCTEYAVAGGNTYTVPGLTPSTAYTYQIKATNAQPAETSPYTTSATISTETITGVAINENDADVVLYPNPAADAFRLSGIVGSARVSVLDVFGKVLLTKELVANDPIQLDALAQGVYFVRIVSSGRMVEKKLLVR